MMQEVGADQKAAHWLCTYKDKEACNPLSALPLEDASVNLLYESDSPISAEKSLLVCTLSHTLKLRMMPHLNSGSCRQQNAWALK